MPKGLEKISSEIEIEVEMVFFTFLRNLEFVLLDKFYFELKKGNDWHHIQIVLGFHLKFNLF